MANVKIFLFICTVVLGSFNPGLPLENLLHNQKRAPSCELTRADFRSEEGKVQSFFLSSRGKTSLLVLEGMEAFFFQGILLSAIIIYGTMYFMGRKRKEYLYFAFMNGGLSLHLLAGGRFFQSLYPQWQSSEWFHRLSLIGIVFALLFFLIFYGWYRTKPHYKRLLLWLIALTSTNLVAVLFFPFSLLSSMTNLFLCQAVLCLGAVLLEMARKIRTGTLHPLGILPGLSMLALAVLSRILFGLSPLSEIVLRFSLILLIIQQLIYHTYLSLNSFDKVRELNRNYAKANRELKSSLNRLEDQSELIQFISSRDTVTGLPNRNQFSPVFEKEINRPNGSGRLLCFVLVEWGDFKTILHRQGVQRQTEMIRIFADRMNHFCSGNDWVCRYSEDRFLLILTLEAQRVSEKIFDLYRRITTPAPLKGNDEEYVPLINMGYTLHKNGPLTQETMLRQLFAALEYGKKQPRDEPCQFNKRIEIFQKEKVKLENKLRQALKRDILEVHYQPQHDSHQYDLVGLEALMRWKDPELGIISPEEFIPLAEELGLIEEIDLYTVKTVLNQLKKWEQTDLKNVRVSINISPLNFVNPDFIEDLIALTANRGISPSRVELELTESILVYNRKQIKKNILCLKEKGFTIALDDFGTGYSSLAYLSDFPVDILKIDKAFIKDLLTDHRKKGIVNSIVAIGQALGMGIISEGVEEREEVVYLQQVGSHAIQGYVFSPALPAAQLMEYVKKSRSA
ncbi:MAG: EAL domain-containing protein [Spirochaetales bacterium]|nr:EAL domain-containing protein [Spirochaetales bacterium]